LTSAASAARTAWTDPSSSSGRARLPSASPSARASSSAASPRKSSRRSAPEAGSSSGSTGSVERGEAIEVARDTLPEPEEGAYYVFQLVGLEVVEGERPLGRVADVTPAPANDVLELDTGLVLPLVSACVERVDLDAGRIVVSPGFADAG